MEIIIITIIILVGLHALSNATNLAEHNEQAILKHVVRGVHMSELYMEGRNGTVRVEGNVVVISREGMMGFFASGTTRVGDKRIPIKNIVNIELGPEPSLGISYIRFATAADEEIRRYNPKELFTNRAGQMFNDPNTVQISNMEQYEMAIKIRDYVENYQTDNSSVVQNISSADEILKYKKLLDDGILTQEEFDAKKKQLLGL